MKFIRMLEGEIEKKLSNSNQFAYWIYMVLFLFFLFPMSVLTTTYNIYFIYGLGFLCILVAIFIFPKYIRNRSIVILIIFSSYLILAGIIVKSNLPYTIVFVLYCLSLLSLFYFIYEANKDIFFLALSDYAFAMIVINGMLSIVYQNGLTTTKNAVKADLSVYFLGIGNQLVIYILAYFTILAIYCLISGKERYRLYLGGILALIGIYFSGSATGYTGGLVYICLYVFYTLIHWVFPDKKFVLSDLKKVATILVVIILIVHILFTIFNIQKYFETFLESFYNKSVTFNARTNIWNEAFSYIRKNPLFGKGIILLDSQIFMKNLGAKFSAHNIFIEISMIGGIPSLLMFILIAYKSFYKLLNIKDSKIRILVFNLLLSFFIMSITELYSLSIIAFILMIPQIIEDYVIHLDNKKVEDNNE